MVFRVARQSVVWACSWHLRAADSKRRRTKASAGRGSRAIRAAPGRAPTEPTGRPKQRRQPGAQRLQPVPCPRLLPRWEAGPLRLLGALAGRRRRREDARPGARAGPGPRPLLCACAPAWCVRGRRSGSVG